MSRAGLTMIASSVTAEVVAAFVDERDGGNLAGIVLDRGDLTEVQMQAVAAALGFPETAFLTAVPDGVRFDVFTPRTRVADCGHATVAGFGLLAQRGRFEGTTTKLTIAGPRAVRLDPDGQVFMRQRPSQFTAGPDPRTVAASLGLSEMTAFSEPPVLARHDVGFLLVPLPHVGLLAAIVPNMRAIEAISRTADVFGYYVFAASHDPGVDATARMFAPGIGIPEESATGMAAGMLAAYLHDRANRPGPHYAFDQGMFMRPPAPSRLNARLILDGDVISEVWVGGHARVRARRVIDV